MLAPIRHLLWAREHLPSATFDLGSSGIPAPPRDTWFDPSRPVTGDVPILARRAIADHVGVDARQVHVTFGATHGYALALAVLTRPGDDVLVEDPTYELMVRTAEACHVQVRRFVRSSDRGFAIDPAAVARALTPKTRAVVVTSLHNPSGNVTPPDVLRECARIAERSGAYLVVNELYAPMEDLSDGGTSWHGSARHLGDNVIAVSSLTKCWGLWAERIGWVAAPSDVIAGVENVIDATIALAPHAHSLAVVQAFGNLGRLSERTRGIVRGKRDRVARWVASQPHLRWTAPTCGLFAFVEHTRAGDLGTVLGTVLAEDRVAVVPGTFFGIPNGFRLAWGAPDDVVDEGLRRLAKALPVGA
ncbi:MAG: pyridoxal phosphate-dependent aminotransferase [Polyangiaceae bacterium]